MGVDDIAGETDESARQAPTFNLVQSIVGMLEPLSTDDQRRVLKTVTTWLGLGDAPAGAARRESGTITDQANSRPTGSEEYPFSGRPEASPKEFLLEKDPKTDVERLACLAYYLTHYRNQPFFKTKDLSTLNMEAAQRAFSNASFTAKNAWRDGFFVAAPKQGLRQLSALGEQYVQALPDHQAAHELRKRMLSRRSSPGKARRGSSSRAPGVDE